MVTGTSMPAAAIVADCRETLLRAALEVLAAERGLLSFRSSARPLGAADGRLAFAARDLVDAVNALSKERQPKGWDS